MKTTKTILGHEGAVAKSLVLLWLSLGCNLLIAGGTAWLILEPSPSVLVQLADGQSVPTTAKPRLYRSDASIVAFVRETLTALYTWPGVLPDGQGQWVDDVGQVIPTETGEARLPSRAYVRAHALKEDFRGLFMQELAEMIPPAVYDGQLEGMLVLDHLSTPLKVSEGRWQVDVVGWLKLIETTTLDEQTLPYSRRLIVSAVDPSVIPAGATPHQAAILGVRQAGLQIDSIASLTLEDSTNEFQP